MVGFYILLGVAIIEFLALIFLIHRTRKIEKQCNCLSKLASELTRKLFDAVGGDVKKIELENGVVYNRKVMSDEEIDNDFDDDSNDD